MNERLTAFIAAVFCVGVSAHAQPTVVAPQDPTAHRHLGLFLRPDIGFGYIKVSSSDTTMSGGAGVFGFALGGAITENLILAGHIYDGVVFSPSVSQGGVPLTTLQNSTLGMIGMGAEFTYYLMPANVYFSGTVAVTRVSMSMTDPSGTESNATQAGFGGRVALGKEWWVSDHWGLGVAGQFSFSSNKHSVSADAPTDKTTAFSLAFSATYN